jgi:hypothetical protein
MEGNAPRPRVYIRRSDARSVATNSDPKMDFLAVKSSGLHCHEAWIAR